MNRPPVKVPEEQNTGTSFVHVRSVGDGVEEYHHIFPGGYQLFRIREEEAELFAERLNATEVRFKKINIIGARTRNSDEPIKV